MKKITLTLLNSILFMLLLTNTVLATEVTLELSKQSGVAGETVTLSGTYDPDTWITVKATDSDGNIVYINPVLTANDGSYSTEFVVPEIDPTTLTIVIGAGSEVTSATFTVYVKTPSYPSPITPVEPVDPDIDVDKALEEISEAGEGSTITIPVQNNAAIPASLLEAVQGKDVTIIFDFGDYSWAINGMSITDLPEGIESFDLSITEIEDAELSKLAGDSDSMEIEITYSGELPFTTILTYKMDATLNEKTAYLYFYNEETGELEYQEEAKVSDGCVCFEFSHASKYVISTTLEPVTEDIICSYQTHVENIGWQGFVSNGEMSGTEGQSLRLEGIKIELEDQENIGVEYSTHVQNIGWQDFVSDGAMSGTEGQALRLEAIKINLTGDDADNYDIYYQVHAQNFGWLDWAKNGEAAGTAGFGYRLEAIRIVVVAKGEAVPGNTQDPFFES
ncbi:hypothetical protein Q5O24_06675 [Eubacteriaceae bacterium ES3]|nr:hypothetical protein Q5O24_06675 [Eubacteriaceae bacterium ES3]